MSPSGEPQPPPEAVLIRLARQARGLSPEDAAALTPIRLRGGRWRQIEKGYERKVPPKPVRAPDLTLAHMARAVGLTPERLTEAGRAEAAEILREILQEVVTQTSPPLSPDGENFRRMVSAMAKEYRLSLRDAEEAARLALQDYERIQAQERRLHTDGNHDTGRDVG